MITHPDGRGRLAMQLLSPHPCRSNISLPFLGASCSVPCGDALVPIVSSIVITGKNTDSVSPFDVETVIPR